MGKFGMLALEGSKLAASLPDAPFVSAAAIDGRPTFGHPARAGLKELVGRDAERIGNFVEVLNLNLRNGIVQKFIDPRLRMADPFRQTRLVDVAQGHQRANVFLQ